MKRAFLLCLFFAAPAYAELPDYVSLTTLTTAPEICGSGIDADNSGAATLCSGTLDNDRDGFNSDGSVGLAGKAWTDPDDTNRWIWPADGTTDGYTQQVGRLCTVDSANDGWQLAQSNGTWTSCTKHSVTPYCPSGMTCYYVDFDAGDDANGAGSGHDCSYANPCKSFKNFGYYLFSLTPPATHLGQLSAGEAVIVLGGTLTKAEGQYFADYFAGDYTFLGLRNPSGNGDIVVRSYPGAEPAIDVGDSTNERSIVQVEHSVTGNAIKFVLHGIEIKNGFASGVSLSGSSTFEAELSNVYSHTNRQSRSTGSQGCIAFNSCSTSLDGCVAHHVLLKDCFDATATSATVGDTKNNVNYRQFRGQGRLEHAVLVNDVSITSTTGDPGAALGSFKHSDADSSLEMTNVIGIGGRYGGLFLGGPTILQDSIIDELNGNPVNLQDVGGETHLTNIIVRRSTLNGKAYANSSTAWTPYTIGPWAFTDNVIIDNDASYTSGEGIVDFQCGAVEPGNDCTDQYNKLVTAGLTFTGNCYNNTGAAAERFSEFPAATGSGGDMTFAQWQSAGYDTAGYVETITFDSNYNVSSSNCTGKGATLALLVPPTPTPTPTPTPPASISRMTNRRTSGNPRPEFLQ